MKNDPNTGFARGYNTTSLGTRDPISRDKQHYTKNIGPAIVTAYHRITQAGQQPSPVLELAYKQFNSYTKMVNEWKEATAARTNVANDKQRSMDDVENFFGAQPRGTKRGVASPLSSNTLFSPPAHTSAGAASALGRDQTPNPYGHTYPTHSTRPTQIPTPGTAAAGSGNMNISLVGGARGGNGATTPTARFTDPVVALHGTQSLLSDLLTTVRTMGPNGVPNGNSNQTAENDMEQRIIKKRRILKNKEADFDRLESQGKDTTAIEEKIEKLRKSIDDDEEDYWNSL